MIALVAVDSMYGFCAVTLINTLPMHKKMTSITTRKPRRKSTWLDALSVTGNNSSSNGSSISMVLKTGFIDEDNAVRLNRSGVINSISSKKSVITAMPYASSCESACKYPAGQKCQQQQGPECIQPGIEKIDISGYQYDQDKKL
jgi:hypothetical protein